MENILRKAKIIIEQYSRDSQAQNKFTSTDKKKVNEQKESKFECRREGINLK